MDIRTLLDRPTSAEKDAVDGLLGPATSPWDGGTFTAEDGRFAFGGHAARARRHLLLPSLHAVQDATGSISRGALGYVCQRLGIPPAEAYGVATFYALFDVDGPGGTTIHVCDDIVCAQYGAGDLCSSLEMELGPEGRRSAAVAWERSPCLGQCDRAPAVMYHRGGDGYSTSAPSDPGSVNHVVFDELPPGVINQARDELRLLRRAGRIGPTLADYREADGYTALGKAVERGPEWVVAALEASDLRGRGGAAFPIGAKWRGLSSASGPTKYVVANGDESEPGTFKDRVLMEGDPFAIVEAMTIFGYATGATKGYVYVRGEYPTAARRIENAIAEARGAQLLGPDIMGAGFDFDLEVRRGAGAYICGEETALFASIEGYRGEPRQKPPFPTERGLFGEPTGINNIETLCAALDVIERGPEAFSAIGTRQSTGPKLFCVSGAVGKPGVYEVAFGTTLGELLDLADAGELGAVLLGGAAGVFVDSSSLDLPLTFEDTRAAGATLGSGAIVVFPPGTDFGPVLLRIARFFRDESCGQCVPCRIGTVRQEESLRRLATGASLGSQEDELSRLEDLSRVMTDASICGLGQTAASAIQSAIRLQLSGAPG